MTPSDYEALCGWHHDPAEVERVMSGMHDQFFDQAAGHLAGSGKGRTVLLHDHVVKVRGSFPVRAQKYGTCVSQGWALAADIVRAVQIALGSNELYVADTATEPIYAGSRIEVGKGQIRPTIRNPHGDGSVGSWAAKWVSEWGVLLRQAYGNIDLTKPDEDRARAWGSHRNTAGVPNELESIAKDHPIQSVPLVRSYEQARDAIANGNPVPVASNYGFQMRRDAKGFARASGRWDHQMCFIAVDDADSRPGLLCMNSWGPAWITGPKRHNQPDGSFWVDADTAEAMLRQGDSHAAGAFKGFPAQSLDTSQW